MRRIVVTEYGYFIGAKGGRIVIRRKGGEVVREVPAFELSQILLETRGASVSSAAMRLLLRHGVELLVLEGGRIRGRLVPVRRGRNIRLLLRQFEIWDGPEGLELAKLFAVGKLRNQSDLLKSLAKNRTGEIRKKLKKAAGEIETLSWRIAELSGSPPVVKAKIVRIESGAGRRYWEAIASILPKEIGFEGRRKRYEGPKDPFNVLLNYLYTILMHEAWLALETAGLEPFLGFLHAPSGRRPALAADLMEEFRQPVVDRVALGLVGRLGGMVEGDRLTKEGRKEALKAYEKRMRSRVTFRGRVHRIRGHLSLQAERLAKAVMGKARYEPFRVRW